MSVVRLVRLPRVLLHSCVNWLQFEVTKTASDNKPCVDKGTKKEGIIFCRQNRLINEDKMRRQ